MAKASGTTRKKTLPHKDGEIFSEGQKIALQNYVEKGNANYFARNGETTDDIKNLDSLMKATNKAMTVFRGVDIDENEDWGKAMLNAKSGDILSDKGYLSTSISKESAEQNVSESYKAAVFQIDVPKGAKMINVNNAFKSVLNKKNVHSAEKEYLFHRNTRLKVINTTTKNGTKYIRAKLLKK